MPAGRYEADDIEVLDGLEAVRARPHLYVGDLSSPAALSQILLEPLCLAVDAKTGGPARAVDILLHADGSAEVQNDGPGLPLGQHPLTGLPFIQVIMTRLHACRDEKADASLGRWCGVGVAVLNALSEWCVVTSRREGRIWEQRFEKGQPMTGLEQRGDCSTTGTALRFKPDPELISGSFDAQSIANALLRFKADVPCVAVTFTDLRAKPV
jgi:DNA gyrase subunit B